MSAEPPLLYLVLGAAGAGRRELLGDLIADGLDEADRGLVLLAETEPSDPAEAKLPPVARWSWNEDRSLSLPGTGDATHIFLVAEGRGNPVDFIEAAKQWLEGTKAAELARILCVVHCQLVVQHPPLLAWYEACAHFSDVLLLSRREGVDNKWLSDFQARFRDQFYPFLIETVKAGRVKNPAMILEPQARRMSHAFDEEPNWVIEADEEMEEGTEEIEAAPEEDPYLARWAGGRRVKELPDIRQFLDQPAE